MSTMPQTKAKTEATQLQNLALPSWEFRHSNFLDQVETNAIPTAFDNPENNYSNSQCPIKYIN